MADFVRALALAWKNLAAYPAGHPALAGSVAEAHRRLADLRGPAGDVTFGIASDGLVYADDKLTWPQAQKLAHALYTRGVAILRFSAETTVADLETLLRMLTGTPGQGAAPIWESLTSAGVVSINLQPVDYSSVQITDDLSEPAQKNEPASLWEDILKALLAGKNIAADARQLLTSVRSVDEFAALLMRHVNDAGTDAKFDPDATFGVRLLARVQKDTPDAATTRVAEAIGTHVSKSTGLKRQLAVQQVLQLLRSLPDPLRMTIVRSVMSVLATDEEAGAALREFASNLDRDEVLEALRYLATMGALSSHATRLLRTLSTIGGGQSRLPPAPPALLAELVELFGQEDIDRFNPPSHATLLDAVTVEMPSTESLTPRAITELGDRVETVADLTVHVQFARTVLELVARHGSSREAGTPLRRVETVAQSLIAGAQFSEALEIVKRLQEIAASADPSLRDAVRESLRRLASSDTTSALISGLLAAPPEITDTIQRLIDALGTAALQGLLIALAEEQNRSRRRKLFDFLSSLGPKIVPEVRRYLSDDRWYVVRNMILLLRGVNDRTSLGDIRRLAQHRDLRVRLEAIKTLLVLDPARPSALLENAINDPDPKLAETAIALAGSYGIREAVGPLLQILDRRDVFGSRRSIRIRALKALGELAEPAALPRIERFFRASWLPWPNREERRAAWESLALYPPEVRAPFVERGLRSRDAEVREICRRISKG